MGNTFRMVLVLTLICAVAAGVLAIINGYTEPQIQARKEAALQESLKECLPSAVSFQEDKAALEQIKLKYEGFNGVYRGETQQGLAGYVFSVKVPGYSSDIHLLAGVSVSGVVQNVKVLDQAETPGLGSKVTDEKFIGQAALQHVQVQEQLSVTKDGGVVQAIAGATISSRAVVQGINQVLSAYVALSQVE